MKPLSPCVSIACIALALPFGAHADNDFHGLVDNRPAEVAGTWVIGGRELQISAKTHLAQDEGPIQVGACVAVDFKGSEVEAIKSQPQAKCLPQ